MSFNIILKKGLPKKSTLSVFLARKKNDKSKKKDAKSKKAPGFKAPTLLSSIKIDEIGNIYKKMKFDGDFSQKLLFAGTLKDSFDRALVFGFGDKLDLSALQYQKLAIQILSAVRENKEEEFDLIIDNLPGAFKVEKFLENFTIGANRGAYVFERKSAEAKKHIQHIRKCTIYLANVTPKISLNVKGAVAIANGANLTRDLINMSAAEATPTKLGQVAKNLGKPASKSKPSVLKISVFDKKKIQQLKMGGLLGVSKGSDQPPAFIIMDYKYKKSAPTVVLVGKGITFDSGGLNTKDWMGMSSMKSDMGGAATVFGAMHAVKEIKPQINVVGIVPATENMSNGSAYKPGDVLTMFNGKTVEVLNTDAEGRLILADAVAYGAKLFKPDCILDFATLTGACVIALGSLAAGVMTSNDDYWEKVYKASEESGDRVWRLPIWDEYGEEMRSKIADLKNIGGRGGGASSAGWFVKQFAAEQDKFIHVDIAGVVSGGPAMRGVGASDAAGYGVNLAIKFLENFTSKK